MNSTLSFPRRAARGGTLVIGGGFAGSYVARRLAKTGATIVNPTNYMLYTPLLPEAASGAVEPRRVVVPIRTMCPHAELVVGFVAEIDVDTSRPRPHRDRDVDITYDELVIALGALSRVPDCPACATTPCRSRTWPTRSPCATTSCTSSSSPTPISRTPSAA